MSSRIHNHLFILPEKHAYPGVVLQEAGACTPLEVNVIFTSEAQARAALRAAGALARSLDAHLVLIAVKEVPLGFPLDRPSVAIPFTQQRLYDFASQGVQGPLDTTIRLYYCRRQVQGLLQALKPKSLVIIGGRKRLWPTRESRLAGILRARGHQVIFPTDK